MNAYSYPLLNKLESYFQGLLSSEQKQRIRDTRLITCQHILLPQFEMFKMFLRIGFLPENICVLGKVYSTNSEVLSNIKKIGINSVQPDFDFSKSFDTQHELNSRIIFNNWYRSDMPNVILDDGGELLRVAHESRVKNIRGIEQTSSGFRKLEKIPFNFSIVNVARSATKLTKETPFIVSLGIKRFEEKIKEWKLIKPKVLIVGQGPIGIEMQKQLREKGFDVISCDNTEYSYVPVDYFTNSKVDVVIGATGSQIISHDELLKLNAQLVKPIYFISMSSSDREFELWKMRDVVGVKGVHDDVSYENVHFANNGFPITFKGNLYESEPQEIELTIALLAASTIYAAVTESTETGFVPVPNNLEEFIRNF